MENWPRQGVAGIPADAHILLLKSARGEGKQRTRKRPVIQMNAAYRRMRPRPEYGYYRTLPPLR